MGGGNDDLCVRAALFKPRHRVGGAALVLFKDEMRIRLGRLFPNGLIAVFVISPVFAVIDGLFTVKEDVRFTEIGVAVAVDGVFIRLRPDAAALLPYFLAQGEIDAAHRRAIAKRRVHDRAPGGEGDRFERRTAEEGAVREPRTSFADRGRLQGRVHGEAPVAEVGERVWHDDLLRADVLKGKGSEALQALPEGDLLNRPAVRKCRRADADDVVGDHDLCQQSIIGERECVDLAQALGEC